MPSIAFVVLHVVPLNSDANLPSFLKDTIVVSYQIDLPQHLLHEQYAVILYVSPFTVAVVLPTSVEVLGKLDALEV